MAKIDSGKILLKELLERGQNELFPKLKSRVLAIVEIYNHPKMQEKLKKKTAELKNCAIEIQVIFKAY